MTDYELLERVLSPRFDGKLSAREQEAFTSMSERSETGGPLSDKQRRWLHSVAGRLGILAPPTRNFFSSMPESERKTQLEQVRTLLPWEKPGYKKVLKPPSKEQS